MVFLFELTINDSTVLKHLRPKAETFKGTFMQPRVALSISF